MLFTYPWEPLTCFKVSLYPHYDLLRVNVFIEFPLIDEGVPQSLSRCVGCAPLRPMCEHFNWTTPPRGQPYLHSNRIIETTTHDSTALT